MRLTADDGRLLDAEYTAEADGPHVAVIVSSRAGASRSRPPRNPDYNQALTLLLQRLGQLGAVLVDALVDSRRTSVLGLPESERRLIRPPIRLIVEPDMNALRLKMAAVQATIGQAPTATKGGNTTKRVRLRVDVPGFGPADASRLATVLAGPVRAGGAIFILTWHPAHFRWEEHGYDDAIAATAAGQRWNDTWTVGVRKGGISPGDRAVIYRQHEHRGLVASGVFASGVQPGQHWDDPAQAVRQAQISLDVVLDYDDRLSVNILRAEVPEVIWDHIQGSGIAVPAEAGPKLTMAWARHLDGVTFRSPDEPRGLGDTTFPEGALTRELVNRYERDPRARRACLDHYGYRCMACGFSFEEHYGELGRSYIHVHHTLELSKVPLGYHVNPLTDLVPVCPNCHAMIHRGAGQALTIDELRQRLMR